ncbi:hypothetical protein [Actinomyces qiguomingii]|uniref:hypothetical protein n=1 Tax=Actinomyces qiguomingii TaxID=2057800 RepID=UPI000CA02BFD|nr:hypothetical protein [Actinomyces qiguomingii]
MNFFSSSPLRRVAGAAAGIVLLLGSVLLGPTAAADDTSSAQFDIVLYENKTADMILNMSFEGIKPDLYCSDDVLEVDDLTSIGEHDDDVDVTLRTEGNSCILEMTGIPVVGSSDGDFTIKHQNNTYIVEITGLSDFKDYDSSTMTVTFPGDVIEADDNAKVSGNKASWKDIATLQSLEATGWDSATQAADDSSNAAPSDTGSSGIKPIIWVLLGLLVLVVIGGIVAFVISRNASKKSPQVAGYPGAAYQPGQPQPGQPGYGAAQPYQPGEPQPYQPGQYQPGQPQPGQYQPDQPGYGAAQPYQPGEPQPYQPGEPQPYQPGQYQPGQPQPGQPGYGAAQPYQPGEPQPPYDQPPSDPYAPR